MYKCFVCGIVMQDSGLIRGGLGGVIQCHSCWSARKLEMAPFHLDKSARLLWVNVELSILSPDVGDDVKQMCLWIKRELTLEAKCNRLEEENRKLRGMGSSVG